MKTQEYGADGLKETTRNALSPSLLLKPNIDSQCSIYEKFIFLCSGWIHVFFYTESWTGGSKLSRSIFAPVSSVVVCVVPSPCNSINLLTRKKMTPVIEHQGVITNLFQTSDLNDYPSSFHHNRGLRYCLTRMIYSTLLFPSTLTDISRQVKGLSFGDLKGNFVENALARNFSNKHLRVERWYLQHTDKELCLPSNFGFFRTLTFLINTSWRG